MSDDALIVICRDKPSAHRAVLDGYAHAQALLADGKTVRISVGEDDDDRSVQQNRYYWGPCLGEISEQARVLGQRYTTEAWHELFKRQFLGFEVRKVEVAGRKRPTVIRSLRSTSTLKVKAMSEYLDKVQAFAASDLGVQFSAPTQAEHESVRYRAPARKKAEQPEEALA